MSKTVKIVVVILVIGAAGYFLKSHFFGTGGQQAPAQGGAVPVSAAEVIEKEVNEWTEFSGRLEATDSVEIKARVSGTITKIHFQDGAMVTKGQPLFTIDQGPYIAEVEKAKGALASAESTYKNTKVDFDRSKSLLSSSTISKREYDTRESSMTIAEGNVKTAQANLDAAQLNLDYSVIKSPISGKIGRAEITEGNVITSGVTTPVLATIVSLSPIYASFEVDEQTFLQNIYGKSDDLLKGIPVKVSLNSDVDDGIVAHIHSFDNQLNISSGTIRVRAIIDNEDGKLVPGLFAKIRLGSPENKKAILVNEMGISTDQSKKFVFVVSKTNTAEYHEVKLGQLVDGMRVVKSGLQPGDKVIVNGLVKVRPNAPIAPEIVDMVSLKDQNPQSISGDKPVDAKPAAGDATDKSGADKSDAKDEDGQAEDK